MSRLNAFAIHNFIELDRVRHYRISLGKTEDLEFYYDRSRWETRQQLVIYMFCITPATRAVYPAHEMHAVDFPPEIIVEIAMLQLGG